MDKWICQTFWTRPMRPDSIENSVNIAAISLYYAHRSGYMVKMYTDSAGKEALKGLNYDSINTDLDSIPEDISSVFFAYSKAVALLKEPLGVIHTDFDVFLQGNCLDKFFEDKNIDIILQGRETKAQVASSGYPEGRELFSHYPFPELYIHKRASNVGVIGFNSVRCKKLYLDTYFKYVNFFKDKDIKYNFIPDLFFEQVSIDYLVHAHNFNVFYLLPEGEYSDINLQLQAKKIGYQHIFGVWKNLEVGKEKIKTLKEKLYANQNIKTKVVWACPGIGKTYLCEKHPTTFVDFDTIKFNNNIIWSPDSSYEEQNLYRRRLLELYIKTCIELSGTNKILLASDVELLHCFYRDFSAVYTLSPEKMKERIILRGEHTNSDIKQWVDTIENKLEYIKKNNIRNIAEVTDFLINHKNELLNL